MTVRTNYTDEGEKITYVGQTIAVETSYLGDGDSVAYAVVQDGEGTKTVGLGYWPPSAEVTIDAPEHVIEAYEAAKRESARKAREQEHANYIEREANTIRWGKTVQVVKGRKVPVGTTGRVIWTGEDRYNRYAQRVGFKTPEGKTYFTSETNLEIVAQ